MPTVEPAAESTESTESTEGAPLGVGIDEELAEEEVDFERVPFDAAHVPLTGATPEEFAPGGWQVENSVVLDWDGDARLDVAIQLVEIPYGERADAPDDRARGLVFAHGEENGLQRVGLGSFLPSTLSGGAMWGGTDVVIDSSASADGREFSTSWVVGARSRSSFELVVGWDAATKRLRLVRRTVGWMDTLDGSHGVEEENFVTGSRTTTDSPAEGKPVVKKSRLAPRFITVEDALPEE